MEENNGGQLLITCFWNTKLTGDGHLLTIFSAAQEV
jgi:hypothetical protein